LDSLLCTALGHPPFTRVGQLLFLHLRRIHPGGRIVFLGVAPCPALRIAIVSTVHLAIRATARNRHKDGLGLGLQRAKGLSRTEADMHV